MSVNEAVWLLGGMNIVWVVWVFWALRDNWKLHREVSRALSRAEYAEADLRTVAQKGRHRTEDSSADYQPPIISILGEYPEDT